MNSTDCAQVLATDSDARPLGRREADGAAGQGIAARSVSVEVATLTRLGPLEAELQRGRNSGHGDRQTAQVRSDRAGAAHAVSRRRKCSTWCRPGFSRRTLMAGWRPGWRGCRWLWWPRWQWTCGKDGTLDLWTGGWRPGAIASSATRTQWLIFIASWGCRTTGWR